MPRHLLDIRDLSTQELDDLMDRADDIIQNPKRYAECMHGKKLATLFYEPSTRTRLSFEAAMLELGGACLVFHRRTALLHPRVKAWPILCAPWDAMRTSSPCVTPRKARPPRRPRSAPCPSSTRATADIITPRRRWRICSPSAARRDGSTSWSSAVAETFSSAARCTASSTAMMRYKSIRFVLISPEELRVPEYVRESMHKNGVSFVEVERLEDVIGTLVFST